ncbi:MAG: CRTAC1 family protein [Thiotrichaceae bacterium]|nr:CRTAC1 family protein [Thiotrichaceae bacterium]
MRTLNDKSALKNGLLQIGHISHFSLLLIVFAAIMPPVQAQTWQFTDITTLAGFNYQHGITSLPGRNLDNERFIIGSGVAAGDYDNDGWVDLYVVRGDIGANLLFRNRGDGTFEEKGTAAGVDLSGIISAGPLFADFDGDGYLDLFVGGVGGLGISTPNLFRNRGDGTFEDITPALGLGLLNNSFSATAGDYDRDGDLDLYVSHWIQGGNASVGSLFQNDGSASFLDVSIASGLLNQTDSDFTANFADINNDNWPDILLAADFGDSRIFINNQDGTFSNTTDPAVITDENGMGAAIGDYDNDGDLDWFVSSIWDPNGVAEANWGVSGNRLYRNRGDGTFEDATDAAGVRQGYWGWGSCFMDFNNDGHLDIFHVNGFKLSAGDLRPQEFFSDPSRMFIANGDATFTEQSVALGVADGHQGRGIVCFDYDQDGDIDIFVANNQESPILYRNDGGNDLHYLDVKLNGTAPNTEAIGAKIYATIGGVTQMRELRAGSNYASQNPVVAHFGVGSATLVDELRVVWPSGEITTLTNLSVDQRVTLPVSVPVLSWPLGETNGVSPDSASSGETFAFKVIYTSSNHNPPTLTELWIELNDDGSYAENMAAALKSAIIPVQNMGLATEALVMMTMLMLGGISFTRPGHSGRARHRETVVFIVLVGLASLVSGCLHATPGGGAPSLSERFVMTEEDPSDLNYSDGKSYISSMVLNYAGDGTINYTFRFCDQPHCTGSANAIGDPALQNLLTIN